MMKRNCSDDKKVRDSLEACYSQIDDKPSLCNDIIRKCKGEVKVKRK